MSWGNAEWDPDCDTKLVEHLFGRVNHEKKKKARKKHMKKLPSVSTGEASADGKYVKTNQVTDNDNSYSVNIILQGTAKKKRKSSAEVGNISKKKKLNSKITTNDSSNEPSRYNDGKATDANEERDHPSCQKTKKKKRKKKLTSLQQLGKPGTTTELKKYSNSDENEQRGTKHTKHKKNNLLRSEFMKIGRNGKKDIDSQGSIDSNEKCATKFETTVNETTQNSIPRTKVKQPYKMKQLKQCLKKHYSSPTSVTPTQSPGNTLRERMMKQLQASHFRYLNEQLYTSKSEESREFFKNNVSTFEAYHDGYRQQVAKWPLNPVNVIINSLKKKPTKTVIADFGCGEAQLAKSLPDHKVYSFDFIATSDLVTPCDMSSTPLENGSIDIVVFCLSLMGSNLSSYILEANRVLKDGGMMMIAEVESRFENVDIFIQDIKKFGFSNTWKDLSHKIFYFLYFKKVSSVKKSNKLPNIVLKACLYKKR